MSGWLQFLNNLFARRVETREISSDDVVILVMGGAGAGKSEFVNLATNGNETAVGSNLKCCTNDIRNIKCPYPGDASRRSVIFVDTPAFGHDKLTLDALGKKVGNWIDSTIARKVKVAGILYLYKISDNRKTESPLSHLTTFRNLCGNTEPFSKIVLVTTMWEGGNQDVKEDREKELKTNHWASMLSLGSKMYRFERTPESAWNIVSALVP